MKRNEVNSEMLREEVRRLLSTVKDPERDSIDPSVLREELLLREGIHEEEYVVPQNGHLYIFQVRLNGTGTGGYSLWVETEVCVPEPEAPGGDGGWRWMIYMSSRSLPDLRLCGEGRRFSDTVSGS